MFVCRGGDYSLSVHFVRQEEREENRKVEGGMERYGREDRAMVAFVYWAET